jgi:O-antigen ligase
MAYNQYGILAERDYDLDFGYAVAFVTLVATVSFIQRRRPVYLVAAAVALAALVRWGSRGGFICLVAFILLALVTHLRRPRTRLAVGAIAAALIPVSLNLNAWLIRVAQFLHDHFGISSRTLNSILQDRALDDSGRDQIYALAVDAIRHGGPFGYGPFGDRPIIGEFYFWGYCHNIALELMVDFGLVGGVALCVLLVLACVRHFHLSPDPLLVWVTVLVLAMATRLLLSDTFWGNQFFWMLLALLLLRGRWGLRRLRLKPRLGAR